MEKEKLLRKVCYLLSDEIIYIYGNMIFYDYLLENRESTMNNSPLDIVYNMSKEKLIETLSYLESLAELRKTLSSVNITY